MRDTFKIIDYFEKLIDLNAKAIQRFEALLPNVVEKRGNEVSEYESSAIIRCT